MVDIDRSSNSIISPKEFYSNAEEKNLLNWFTYEVALTFEKTIEDNRDFSRPKFIKKSEVVPLAISLAKRVKAEFLRSQSSPTTPSPTSTGWGRKKLGTMAKTGYRARSKSKPRVLNLSPRWIMEAMPKLATNPIVEDLTEDLVDSLNDLLDFCTTCPTHCLSHPNAYCTMSPDDPIQPISDEGYNNKGIFNSGLLQLFNDFLLNSNQHKQRKGSLKKKNVNLAKSIISIEKDFNLPALPQSNLQNATPPNAPHAPAVYQIKITIRDIKPPVWRRILIHNTSTFADLHDFIQDSFGWENCHLHDFAIKKKDYLWRELRIVGLPPDGDIDSLGDNMDSGDFREDEVHLSEFLSPETPKAMYTYDFGDNWEHDVLLEKVLPIDPTIEYPTCVKSKGNCPPEDCGGPWGYMESRDEDFDKDGED